MEDGFIAADVVARVVKSNGSDAVVEDDRITIYPKDSTDVRVHRLSPDGVGRRLVAKIGAQCKIPTHLFWNATPLALVPPKAKRSSGTSD